MNHTASDNLPENFDRLVELLDAATRETITPEEGSELVELLRADAAARQYYIEAVDVEISLRRKFAEQPLAVSDQPSASEEVDAPRPRSKSLMQWASRHPKGPAIAVTVAIFAAVLLAMGVIPVSQWIAGNGGNIEKDAKPAAEDKHVAILNGWQNAKWLEDSRPPLNNPRLKVGRRLVLESGKIEVKYLTGARVVIEGPAEFVVGGKPKSGNGKAESGKEIARSSSVHHSSFSIQPSNAGFLRRGSLVARIEGKEAEGFTIDTPSASVEDFGTEFGVEVDVRGAAEFVVLSGKVDVVRDTGDGSEQRVRLVKDQAAFVATRGGSITKRSKVNAALIAAMQSRLKIIDESPATVMPGRVSSTTELRYANDVSAKDLLHGLTAMTTGWNLTNGATPASLNDGKHGTSFDDVGNPAVATIAWTTVGATATYDLGLGANGLGWDITGIQSIAAWNSAAFGNQAYTLEVKFKGAASFKELANVDCQPLNEVGATKVALANDDGGVLASGVELIRFTANSVNGGAKGGAFTFREIDVFGVETTPPATVGETGDTEEAEEATGDEDAALREQAEDTQVESKSELQITKSEMKK